MLLYDTKIYKIPNLKNTKKTGRGLRKKEGMQNI